VPASGHASGARASWGWHRLADDWAERIVAAANVRPGELVLDIGAGQGALTGPLVRAGARVIAVELHEGRAEALRHRFAPADGRSAANDGAVGRVTVVHGDATGLRLPRRPFRVVASPPYGITAGLLSLLLAPGSRLVAADLVLQRAAVRKYAERRVRGYRITQGQALPRRAFRPPPRVDSAVLVIRRHA
jgi:23S rRNA (adenine-N6)-dimethyltransferase